MKAVGNLWLVLQKRRSLSPINTRLTEYLCVFRVQSIYLIAGLWLLNLPSYRAYSRFHCNGGQLKENGDLLSLLRHSIVCLLAAFPDVFIHGNELL